MSDNEDLKLVSAKKSNGSERGSFRQTSTWNHLGKEKQEQYQAIEERVREKMRKGEL